LSVDVGAPGAVTTRDILAIAAPPWTPRAGRMAEFFNGWAFTIVACAAITVVFLIAYLQLRRELRFVKALADFLGYDVLPRRGPDGPPARPDASVLNEVIRDEAAAIRASSDPAWAMKQVRGWELRAQRLEPALAFWADFLRQLGLLGTVVGLGMSLAIDPSTVDKLLAPLGLAVWTTVFGLFFSIWLTAQFGQATAVWADVCERNIEAWEARRKALADARVEP
jgi:hypothetical protein